MHLIYAEPVPLKRDALHWEATIKKQSRRRKLWLAAFWAEFRKKEVMVMEVRVNGTAAVMRWDGGLCSDGDHPCDYVEMDRHGKPFCCKYGSELETARDANGQLIIVRRPRCAKEHP